MCQVMGVDMTEKEITMTRDAGCPEHYRGDGFITCSRAMKAALGRWPAATAPYCTMAVWWWCCAFKYVWRCMVKGKTLEDIDKAKLANIRRSVSTSTGTTFPITMPSRCAPPSPWRD